MLPKPWWKVHAKGRVFLARKLVCLSSEDLQQTRLNAPVGFSVLMGLRSDNWKAWLSLSDGGAVSKNLWEKESLS